MPELSTLGHVIKGAYEGQSNTNAFTDSEKQKLAGIEQEATRNSPDADLRNRATHTGTQTAATIIDLPDLLAGKVDAVPGKQLSDENYTLAEKQKLAGLNPPSPRGVIGPPIPAVHALPSGIIDVEPMTPENLRDWDIKYDQFNMLLSDGEGFAVPSWANYARVTAAASIAHLPPEKRLYVCIELNSSTLLCSNIPGSGQTLFPVVNLNSGIVPVEDADYFTVSVWHDNDEVRRVINGPSTFINIELFESI